MRKFLLAVLLFSVASVAQSSSKPAESAAPSAIDLPVHRVVLYKNGVGYFEHSGLVRGNQELNIQFTTGQLNDVLKSLTVVDLGGGQVTGIRYNSIAPLSQRLSTLRLQLGENASRSDFLNALRGSRVEVRSGAAPVLGRLLSVGNDQRIDPKTGMTEMLTRVTLVTDSGDMRSFDLSSAVTVHIADPDLNKEVGRYLNLVASARARDQRIMTISTSGTGERQVDISYISEVPVWKSTYRIVLPKDPKQKALLQGWAIIDNTVGEDWKNVELSLVAGAPQSFMENLSQPLYMRRPTIALPKTAMLTPQTHEGTMEAEESSTRGVGGGVAGGVMGGVIGGIVPPPPPPPMSAPLAARKADYMARGVVPASGLAAITGVIVDALDAVVPGAKITVTNTGTTSTRTTYSDDHGLFVVNNLEPGTYTVSVSLAGFQTYRTSGVSLLPSQIASSNIRLQVGSVNQTVEVTSGDFENSFAPAAQGAALGDLFEYAIKQKITVLKNQSALVPIVQSRIDAEKVTLWNDSDQVPLRALWITNSSGLTLDAGTFNIVEADSFAGEGLLGEIKPDEKRLLSYAADTSVRITTEDDSDTRPYTHLRIAKGLMKLTREQREKETYTIHNADTSARSVIIEHPVRDGWQLADGVKPDDTSASYYRFRVPVEAGKTAKLSVEEYHPEETLYALTNLTDDQIVLATGGRHLDPAIEQALRRILAKKTEVANVDSQIASRRQEVERINREQSRLRENMKVLKGSPEEKALLQRYVAELNQQEDSLASLNKEIHSLTSDRLKLATELNDMAQQLTFDEKL